MAREVLLKEMRDDLNDIQSDISDSDTSPVEMTWQGVDYPVFSTVNKIEQDFIPGGFLEDYELTLTFQKFQMGIDALVQVFENGIPKNGDTVKFDGKIFRIIAVDNRPSSSLLRIDLGTINK